MEYDIKAFLEDRYQRYNSLAFIEDDPIQIPHQYNFKEDIEISGFLTAILAWGQRKTIISKAKLLMQMMDNQPYAFLTQAVENDFSHFLSFKHRTFNGDDCQTILLALSKIYQQGSGLEQIFTEGFLKGGAYHAINFLSQQILTYPHLSRTQKHLARPSEGSAAKRINMYLRWMVRKDENGVDFGLWKGIRPDQLICPLDIHSGRMARKLGLLHRNNNDWKAAIELTAKLSTFDPIDPVKYDFALFGTSIYE